MFEKNFVTKSDYLNAYGINLELEIPKGDEPTNAAERYIWRIESYCNSILAKFNYQEVNENNVYYYKMGVMCMIYHSLKIGLMNLNGLTDEAFNYFRQGGFCNVPKGDIYG